GQTCSSGNWVSGFYHKFIRHRTTDIRHLTSTRSCQFFTAHKTAATGPKKERGGFTCGAGLRFCEGLEAHLHLRCAGQEYRKSERQRPPLPAGSRRTSRPTSRIGARFNLRSRWIARSSI